jgi:hypothetical protein
MIVLGHEATIKVVRVGLVQVLECIRHHLGGNPLFRTNLSVLRLIFQPSSSDLKHMSNDRRPWVSF